MAESEKPEGTAAGKTGAATGGKPSMRPRKTLDLTAQEVPDPVSAADAPSGEKAQADTPSDTVDPGVTPAVWPDAASTVDVPPATDPAAPPNDAPEPAPAASEEAPPLERAPAAQAQPSAGPGFVPFVGSAVAGAVLAVLAVAALDQAGVIGNRPAADTGAIERRVADLEGRVARLPGTPAADPAVGQRLGALEKSVAERGEAVAGLQRGLDGLRAELGRVQQQGAAPASAPQASQPAAPDLTPRLEQLDRKLAALEEALSGQGGRIDEARRAADAAQERARAVDPAALEATRAELAALKARIDQREAALPAPREARAAAGLAAVAALKDSLDRGAPIGEAVASVKRLFTDADTKPLDTLPASGAPSLKTLGEALARDLAGVPLPAPAADAGVLDRLGNSLSRLVKVTPAPGTAEPSGTGADAARSRVIQRLDRGDYRGALEAWNGLDEAAKQATGGARTALAARLAAEDTIDSLRRAALSAFGTGGKP